MDCSCDILDGLDEGESPEFFEEKEIAAKTPHKCGECGREINKGEKYLRAVGKWDGVISTYKTCSDCKSIREQFFCKSGDFGYIFYDLREYISEVDGEIPQQCISKLTPVAKSKVCDMIQEHWNHMEEDDES